jgi:phage tail-like protein
VSNSTDQLIVRLEGEVIQTLSLDVPIIRIGRTPDNGLSLSHQMVSRAHAELRLEPGGLMLTDLGSSNGTFIGTRRLLPNQPQVIPDGGTFRIGPFLLTYQSAKAAAQPQEEEDEQQPTQGLVAKVPVPVPVAPEPPTLQQVPQPTRPVPRRPLDERDSIYRHYLPDIFQENDFLRRFLYIFEDIWEPLEQRQDHIEMYFDPHTCPASFLPWLASWLDLPFNPHWPEARHRRLLAQAMDLYSWRGTRYGLIRMIEVCTGLTPVIRDSASQPFVFHIRITLPTGTSGETLDRALIEELIQAHKPAHAGYILEVVT